MKRLVHPVLQCAYVALYIAGLVEVIIGAIWTRATWATYVVRGTDFNWWAPANILLGLVILVVAYRLDSHNNR